MTVSSRITIRKTGIAHGAYTNSYRYEDGFIYGNGWNGRQGGGLAQMVMHAVSHPTHLISLANMRIDAAGRTPNILAIHDLRVTSPTVPAVFLNMQTGGNTGPTIAVNFTSTAPPAVPVLSADFVNWTHLGGGPLNPANDVVTTPTSGGSALRFQQGLASGSSCSAAQLTSASARPQPNACFH